jgi:hypothetical protein
MYGSSSAQLSTLPRVHRYTEDNYAENSLTSYGKTFVLIEMMLTCTGSIGARRKEGGFAETLFCFVRIS